MWRETARCGAALTYNMVFGLVGVEHVVGVLDQFLEAAQLMHSRQRILTHFY